MEGFFFASETLSRRQPLTLVPKCGECGVYKTCESPKIPVAGKGKRKILIVGESPGAEEDRRGIPFVGPAGTKLRDTIREFDIDPEEDCWITNAVICRTSKSGQRGGRTNRTPTWKEVDYCRPNLIRTIQELKPRVIIPLGATAVDSLLGWLWKEDPGAIGRWIGWRIPCQSLNSWVCPAWHPSFLLRASGAGMQEEGWGEEETEGEGASQKDNPVRELIWKSHLERAVRLDQRPWKTVPEWVKTVQPIINPDDALPLIKRMILSNRPVAFDYETDRLKPDHEDARIVSCSMSDGKTTFAFPWHGEAIRTTLEFLVSAVPKIASNQKFEDRWTRRKLGVGVNNWMLDTMLAAHCRDNRPGITSIKFLAFTMLGQDAWDTPIAPFLKSSSDNHNAPNRIGEINLEKLLVYNGMDSLMEWKVSQIQAKKIGIPFGE